MSILPCIQTIASSSHLLTRALERLRYFLTRTYTLTSCSPRPLNRSRNTMSPFYTDFHNLEFLINDIFWNLWRWSIYVRTTLPQGHSLHSLSLGRSSLLLCDHSSFDYDVLIFVFGLGFRAFDRRDLRSTSTWGSLFPGRCRIGSLDDEICQELVCIDLFDAHINLPH